MTGNYTEEFIVTLDRLAKFSIENFELYSQKFPGSRISKISVIVNNGFYAGFGRGDIQLFKLLKLIPSNITLTQVTSFSIDKSTS